MTIDAKLMTADELIRLPRGRERHELVRGVLRTMPLATWPEAIPANNFMHSLRPYELNRRPHAVLTRGDFSCPGIPPPSERLTWRFSLRDGCVKSSA